MLTFAEMTESEPSSSRREQGSSEFLRRIAAAKTRKESTRRFSVCVIGAVSATLLSGHADKRDDEKGQRGEGLPDSVDAATLLKSGVLTSD